MNLPSFKEFCLKYFGKTNPPLPKFHEGGIVIGHHQKLNSDCGLSLDFYKKLHNNSKISSKSVKINIKNPKILGVSADFIINDDLLDEVKRRELK